MSAAHELVARARPAGLEDVAARVVAGERLSIEDGLRLHETPDLHLVGALANHVRERLHGDTTTYIVNRYLHYSNVCWDTCKFCSFYRKPGEPGSFTKPAPR